MHDFTNINSQSKSKKDSYIVTAKVVGYNPDKENCYINGEILQLSKINMFRNGVKYNVLATDRLDKSIDRLCLDQNEIDLLVYFFNTIKNYPNTSQLWTKYNFYRANYDKGLIFLGKRMILNFYVQNQNIYFLSVVIDKDASKRKNVYSSNNIMQNNVAYNRLYD